MSDRDTPIPAQSGNEKRYTVDEFLAHIEPQYWEDKDTIRKCIAGLTACAAQMAAQHQEEDLPQFRRLCMEMAEFWGLTDDDTPKGYQKMAEQYGSTFDQAVSAARESGQAPEMSEQARQSVLDGLDLYAREMRANDESLEDWATECDVLAEVLERQWRTENALSKLSDMQMGECEMKQISTDQLRRMEGREGLVLQGCGGDLQEWVDGINEMLTAEGILKNGSRLEDVSTFQHDGLTNLLFSFEGADLAMGRLAMWRLQTHEQFGGTWLSDYVPNRLGGFIQEQTPQKPDCQLIGEDGNIFNLIGIASRTLRQNGLDTQAEEMRERIMGGECGDYYAALNVIGEYVNITGPKEYGMEMGGM